MDHEAVDIVGGRGAYAGQDLNGGTAVVIGGISGIGQAIALELAHAGADVIAAGRQLEQVRAIAPEIEAAGSRSLSTTADVSDRALAVEWASGGFVHECDCTGRLPYSSEFRIVADCAWTGIANADSDEKVWKAEEVVGAAVLLASDAAKFMTGSVVVSMAVSWRAA